MSSRVDGKNLDPRKRMKDKGQVIEVYDTQVETRDFILDLH